MTSFTQMFSFLLALASCKRYAVLLAGSNGWSNYRHQADICTIYQLLINRGFTDDEITMMQYDDIATYSRNPFKGQIFHTSAHENVYPGTEKMDYTKSKVTANNFYSALASVKSTSQDYVFIYYDNHGGPGILGMPAGGNIQTAQLNDALNQMNNLHLYKYCLFGIEACYAGSLAQEFTAPNMCTITAANEKESSYAAVYDSAIGTYLSNEFTNYWINEMETNPTETIGDLYTNLKSLTKGSHVMFYGDESMKSMTVDTFFGTPNKLLHRSIGKVDIVPQREATKMTLKMMKEHTDPAVRTRGALLKQKLGSLSRKLNFVLDALVKNIDPKNYDKIMKDVDAPYTKEYYQVLDVFLEKFGEMNPDDFGRLMVLKALVATHPAAEVIQTINEFL
ncbi:Clan CD, family C13, asparaginyl endopeptidase-like cysteine peptidase [Histomonas meleagridis]|uniref:Clan CD, family C13, asparaginyl endopeptidase-like cysteine peptidase n=1 Tax=Histomonas meleagridis TaxID=135588 RepID=UPI003559EB08|nr:Clan CD, family C13, asparaginyl endopeptidase-like cysteine peptidase [Histomonas meleagridis]KAH0802066.1 Clan CD, family C13, asparaginyl endopeptidase-like cysteine peptidase [Histomonas meleagridis]